MVNYISRTVFYTCLAIAASYLCVNSANLHAQTVSGTILGTIQDQQGAVIPNAEVSARNQETGQVRKTNADGSGNYRVSSVPAGTYEVSALRPGSVTSKKLTGKAVQIVILDKSGKAVAVFGTNPNADEIGTNTTDPAKWRPGALMAPHGVAFNEQGDVFVSEFNQWGRVQRFNLQPQAVTQLR